MGRIVQGLSKKDEIRITAENDLAAFIRLVHPQRLLGSIHVELIRWWTREDAKSHQMTLLPRDHGKSAMIAYRVAWEIVRNPAIRILYVSSTLNLAQKQVKFIKDILTSDKVKEYWPELINQDEGKREKWTETEFSVDHPIRKAEAIRDPTVFIGGMSRGKTGMHCDIAVLDDIVVIENAYTEDGREKVRTSYGLLSSIEGTDAKEWVVGTRYHPKDLYGDLLTRMIDQYDEDGDITHTEELFEVFQRQVEERGDGTGQFLWPKQQRADGKWFGFDRQILAVKRAQYSGNMTQYRAQYYNDPLDADGASISKDLFQYYDKSKLKRIEGKWAINGHKLNVFASIDFAYSYTVNNRKADYTSIVVVGVDSRANYYVLDIDRFQTDKISEYFQHILALHTKWGFRKLRAEVTAAQKVIVNNLKDSYIRQYGLSLSIDESKPNRHQGTKEERMKAALYPLYENYQIWHYEGGHCQTLEDELIVTNPPHDDIMDAFASVIEICILPSNNKSFGTTSSIVQYVGNARFGGIQ